MTLAQLLTIQESAQIFASAAAHNFAQGRTVFAHEQQKRADALKEIVEMYDTAIPCLRVETILKIICEHTGRRINLDNEQLDQYIAFARAIEALLPYEQYVLGSQHGRQYQRKVDQKVIDKLKSKRKE